MSYHFGSWWDPSEDIVREQMDLLAKIGVDATKALATQAGTTAGAAAREQVEAGGAAARADIEAGGEKVKADIEQAAANAPGIAASAAAPYILFGVGGLLLYILLRKKR